MNQPNRAVKIVVYVVLITLLVTTILSSIGLLL
ncbi:stressosome-associated protein Prli42 [Paenibacillus pasadenensis]|nr:stressosome-associated protein Prli42 [Paenibacillus pasadenensis]MCM3747330.1 stressosome-associated protein Prli42 [Paenibacillus pasadenensis]